MKKTEEQLSCTAKQEVLAFGGIVNFFSCWRPMRVHLLWSSRECRSWRATWDVGHRFLHPGNIFSERKLVQWPPWPLETEWMQKKINAINADTEEVDIDTISNSVTSKVEKYLRCVARQITLSAYLQGAVLVRCCSAGLLKTETHWNGFGRRCSVSARGLMDNLICKLFHVHIANCTVNPVNLQKFVIVSSAFHAPSYIIHAVMESHAWRKAEVRPYRNASQQAWYKPFTPSHQCVRIDTWITIMQWSTWTESQIHIG